MKMGILSFVILYLPGSVHYVLNDQEDLCWNLGSS